MRAILSLCFLLGSALPSSARIVARAPAAWSRCRAQPGDPSFPTQSDWAALNAQVGGRLLTVVPSAKFCHELPAGECTPDQWTSARFIMANPGSMLQVSWFTEFLVHLRPLLRRLSRQTGNRYFGQGSSVATLKLARVARIIYPTLHHFVRKMALSVDKETYPFTPSTSLLLRTFKYVRFFSTSVPCVFT